LHLEPAVDLGKKFRAVRLSHRSRFGWSDELIIDAHFYEGASFKIFSLRDAKPVEIYTSYYLGY
jgi:hypothetical protein